MRNGNSPRNIPGVPRARIAGFFKGAPTPLTSDFCERLIWWWRSLPALVAPKSKRKYETESLAHAALVMFGRLAPQDQQKQLERWFQYELRARLTAANDWKPALLKVPLRFPGPRLVPLVDFSAAEIDTEMTWAAAVRVLRPIFEKQKRLSPVVSNRVLLPENWPARFKALELIDRRTLLGAVIDNDEWALVRKSVRDAG